MEFLDEYDESRPRIVFQSRSKPSSTSIDSASKPYLNNKPLLIISLTISLLFLGCSFIFLHSQILNPLFLWLFLSFLIGPFAPLSLTAGDIRVGQGTTMEFPTQIESIDEDESKKKPINKRNRGKRSDLSEVNSNGSFDFVKNSENSGLIVENKRNGDGNGGAVMEEKEWSEEDLGLLKKQLVKNPIGKSRRWEVISEVFKGRHSVESVINKAKSLGKEKPDDSDSYSKFLKDRKPVDKRLEEGNEEVVVWSSGEDIALLNALKTFPKEVAMRWEKIAAAIPGKSKAACMKRVTELKKEFRSSKGNES
ncbi:transcription factor MAMYB-like [Silene latifolia]|uniref:transcription factor MAMYB-like n=1 Tax=Silene latifolia TaxID=37657 RepID=UPI003D77798A